MPQCYGDISRSYSALVGTLEDLLKGLDFIAQPKSWEILFDESYAATTMASNTLPAA